MVKLRQVATGMARPRRFLIAGLFGVWVLAGGEPVSAQELPGNSVTEPPAQVPAQVPVGCPGGPVGPAVPGTRCPDGSMPTPPTSTPPGSSVPRDPVADRRLRDVMGLDETGDAHPLHAYEIGCDEGSWNAFLRKLWCGAQALPFAAGKWAVGVGIDLLGWALEFQMAEALAPVAGLMSRIYDTSLIGPLGIRHVAWTLALAVGGWHLLRARYAQGATEFATTFLVAAIGAIVLANPQGYLEGSIDLAENASGAVLEGVHDTMRPGEASEGPDAVRDQVGDVLREAFVAEPYDLINWGEPLSGACAQAREQILDQGPWGSDDEPRDIMRDAGCEANADFNATPTDSRAVASLVVGLAAVGATVLLVCIALVVFLAQLTLVAMFAGASVVWALALFPGARELLWWWLGRLVWAVAATVAATFVLSWLAITVTAALAASDDLSIIQRCLVALLVVAFGFRLRGHLARMAEGASRRIRNRLTEATGHRPWLADSSGGFLGGSGAGLAATARNWAFDIPGGQLLYYRAYVRTFTRGYRRRHHHDRHNRGDRRRSYFHGQVGTAAWRATGNASHAAAPVLRAHALRSTVRAHTAATAASARLRVRLHDTRVAPPGPVPGGPPPASPAAPAPVDPTDRSARTRRLRHVPLSEGMVTPHGTDHGADHRRGGTGGAPGGEPLDRAARTRRLRTRLPEADRDVVTPERAGLDRNQRTRRLRLRREEAAHAALVDEAARAERRARVARLRSQRSKPTRDSTARPPTSPDADDER